MLTKTLAQKLFSIVTKLDFESFLTDIGAKSGSRWKWTPLGGRENNAGSVNLAVEPGQALVERITNALDAHIELKYELANRPSGLDSPRLAVTKLWGLESVRLSRESREGRQFISEMAPKTVVRAVGPANKKETTVIVEDRGVGQHPTDFPNTLLSLGESNKISKPYLMGAFGQGGSSTFMYCPYSVIISRRHAACLRGRQDLVGWTLVRKYDDDSLKAYRYEYLVDENNYIPTLSPGLLEDINLPFESGTCFVHVAYDLGRLKALWSLVGYRYFDNLLFDPVLPYRIEDHRSSKPINRHLSGARNRLDSGNSVHNEAENVSVDLAQWGGKGQINARYWVFSPGRNATNNSDDRVVKLDSYLDYDQSPRTIIFTLNGQRHHYQEKRIVRNEGLGALADYLLMHIDCDDMSLRLKKEVFPATRAGATSGEQREELLLRAVKEVLSDPWLKQKTNEIVQRRQEQVTSESTRRVRQMLDKLISVYRTEQQGGGRQGSNPGGRNPNGQPERTIHDPPTFLVFADQRLLEIQSGQQTTIDLRTDGPDSILSRRKRRAQLNLECDSDDIATFSIREMQQGRIPIQVRVPVGVPAGHRGKITATLEMGPATYITTQRDIRIIPPPKPYAGIEPPTSFEFAKCNVLRVGAGETAQGNIHTNARNDVLHRAINPASIDSSCDIPGVVVTVRGPRNGTATAVVSAPSETPQQKGTISTVLKFKDGLQLVTSRPCEIIPPKKKTPRGGIQNTSVPNYKVIRVWKVAPDAQSKEPVWEDFSNPWDEKKIGSWEMNNDELSLYINMDESRFRKERSRLSRGQYSSSHVERITDRYVAYLAFHLFQLQYQPSNQIYNDDQKRGRLLDEMRNSEEKDLSPHDPDSEEVGRELQRVAATLIQALRSEAELTRFEAQAAER